MAESTTTVREEVRRILGEHARLAVDAATLADDDDLYAAGMTSHASVTIMLACEDAYDVEFSQAQLKKSTFASIASIAAALAELGVAEDQAPQ